MLAWLDKHKLEPVVDSVRPFDEIISAIDRMEKGEQTGKLVVEF